MSRGFTRTSSSERSAFDRRTLTSAMKRSMVPLLLRLEVCVFGLCFVLTGVIIRSPCIIQMSQLIRHEDWTDLSIYRRCSVILNAVRTYWYCKWRSKHNLVQSGPSCPAGPGDQLGTIGPVRHFCLSLFSVLQIQTGNNLRYIYILHHKIMS